MSLSIAVSTTKTTTYTLTSDQVTEACVKWLEDKTGDVLALPRTSLNCSGDGYFRSATVTVTSNA